MVPRLNYYGDKKIKEGTYKKQDPYYSLASSCQNTNE